MKNKLKGNKGITLVVLIITIIVMLILTGVVIDLSVDGGLFGKAQEAVNKTNAKVSQTQGRVDELMGILEGVEVGPIDPSQCQHTYSNGVCTKCGKKCKHTFVNGVCTKCDYVEVVPEIGAYVYYEREYTDAYQSGKTFDATNGWRYLGTTTDENEDTYYMIISTGIPVKLSYSSSTVASWWDGNTNLTSGARAAKGLADPTKFAGIIFEDGTTNGASFIVGNRAEGVRNLTLADINTAANISNGNQERAIDSVADGIKNLSGNAYGLFDITLISGYTAGYYYWIATSNNSSALCSFYYIGGSPNYLSSSGTYGIRPVVLLSDIVFKAPTEGHTYWTFE